SAFNASDIQTYRQTFNLPANIPTPTLVPGLPDPGFNDWHAEATADLEIAGAIAPNATILYVYTDHVFYAEQYAIDQNLAPVLSVSFGSCEKGYIAYPGERDAYRSLMQQANAQGITAIASSGDAGPADCETQQVDKAGFNGITVDVPASLPEVTGV